MLKKTVLENMGYCQKESEIEKKVGCFKVPLRSLGLKLQSWTATEFRFGRIEVIQFVYLVPRQLATPF